MDGITRKREILRRTCLRKYFPILCGVGKITASSVVADSSSLAIDDVSISRTHIGLGINGRMGALR